MAHFVSWKFYNLVAFEVFLEFQVDSSFKMRYFEWNNIALKLLHLRKQVLCHRLVRTFPKFARKKICWGALRSQAP